MRNLDTITLEINTANTNLANAFKAQDFFTVQRFREDVERLEAEREGVFFENAKYAAVQTLKPVEPQE